MKYKILLLLTLFTKTKSILKETPTCSILYKNIEFGESLLEISDNDVVSHLDDKWNETLSFNLNEGCKLTTCNESYFLGNCLEYENTNRNPNDFRIQTIKSANCTCFQGCKCENVKMRISDCARAYIGNSCNSCNPYYTDLQGENKYFPLDFSDNVTSIIVKKDCSLIVYKEEDFKGHPYSILTSINENFNEKIGSYKCKCQNSNYSKNISINFTNDEKLLNIPKSLENITSMINGKYGNHKGLLASLQSIKQNRSPNNAYILLIGTSGSGKSSTINFLLDNSNMAKVGEDKSTTVDIQEFCIPISVDKLEIGNSEIRIIDTPGLGDTKGLESDAKYLAALDDFLSSHEDLSQYFPNVILIFGKFSENRFSGEGADFVKMLKGFDLLRNKLIDKEFPNVIFVLTHFMSETRNLVRNPTERIQSYKSVISNYSLHSLPIKIVLAENKPFEHFLLKMNGNYKLPNGEFYPKNLIREIESLTSGNADLIGNSIIHAAFDEKFYSNKLNISSLVFPISNSTDRKFTQFHQSLMQNQFELGQTQISTILSQTYLKMSKYKKLKFPGVLPYLQKAFKLRNMNSIADIPKSKVEILKFFSEIELNDAVVYLLEEGFQIKLPLLQNIPTGHGYDVFKDAPLSSSPFNWMHEKISDNLGFSIPKILHSELDNSISNEMHTHGSMSNYIENRLNKLRLKNITIPEDKFKGEIKPGHNIYKSNQTMGNHLNRLTGIRKYFNFLLGFDSKVELNENFILSLQGLRKFNNSDKIATEKWISFFEKFGTHVVNSSSGGGEIEIILTSQENFELKSNTTLQLFNILQFVENYGLGDESWIKSDNYTLNFNGGDPKFQVKSFKDLSLSESVRTLVEWKKSLKYNPIMFPISSYLMPMSEVVKLYNETLALEVQMASEALFKDELKYDFWREKYELEELKKEQAKIQMELEEQIARRKKEEAEHEEKLKILEEERKEKAKKEELEERERARIRAERLAEEERQRKERERKMREEADRMRRERERIEENNRRERELKERELRENLRRLQQKRYLPYPSSTCGDGYGFRCWHNDWKRRDRSAANSGWSYRCSFSPWFGGRCYCTAMNSYVDCYC